MRVTPLQYLLNLSGMNKTALPPDCPMQCSDRASLRIDKNFTDFKSTKTHVYFLVVFKVSLLFSQFKKVKLKTKRLMISQNYL